MKIEKNKPLPNHTKLSYDECCAKLILEELFPNRYHELILADRPDLQGKDVGIEVTSANDRKMQEALGNAITAHYSTDPGIKAKCIERMAQLGVKYTEGIQAWPGFCPTFDLTREAVNAKVKKLKKGNYKPFQRYELFIFTDTWYHEDLIEDAKQYLFKKSISDYYKTIYVLSEGTGLHVFETDTAEHLFFYLDSSVQSERNIRARRMVEEAEDCE